MQKKELFFRDVEIADRYKVSRPTIWRWVSQGKLPKPTKLAGGTSRWRLCDIETWENAQVITEDF